MKSITKFICMSSIGLGLSACGVTQGVLQGAYDSEADNDCRKQHHEADTIHAPSNSACRHGRYDSSLNPNSKDWGEDSNWKKEKDAKLKENFEKNLEE